MGHGGSARESDCCSSAARTRGDCLACSAGPRAAPEPMTSDDDFPLEGGCTCRAVRYRMRTKPLFVHCCHCRWCQRETGSAFVLNAMIEADRVELLQGKPEVIDTPSLSGRGQKISRCSPCRTALWSSYPARGAASAVR